MDLKMALEIVESNRWCSLRVITAHVKKGTGGKVLELPKCRIARKQNFKEVETQSGITRNANSNPNFTRNVELANSQRIITIHPILITHVNNQALV